MVLSNLLLQIYSGISIVFVDEPGDGVGDRLVKKQLKMIIEYAKRNNVMLVLTTHRIDLAEDLVTKRYDLKDGVLKQIEIKKEKEEEKS